MRKSVLALLLACFALPAFANKTILNQLAAPINQQDGICQDCDPEEGGGSGGGGTPPPPPPFPAISLAKVDATQGTITIQLTNGATWVIDDDLNKLFISSGSKSAEIDLNTALLQWAGNNQNKANQMRVRIHALATTAIRENKLVRGAPVQGLIMGLPGGQPWGCYYNIYYCNVKPQPDFGSDPNGGGGGWGTYSWGFYGELPSGINPGNQQDHNYWQHFRDLACGSQKTGARMMVIGTLGAIAACPFWETGVGALGCGAAVFSIVDGYDGYTENAQMCQSPYPGPGKW